MCCTDQLQILDQRMQGGGKDLIDARVMWETLLSELGVLCTIERCATQTRSIRGERKDWVLLSFLKWMPMLFQGHVVTLTCYWL